MLLNPYQFRSYLKRLPIEPHAAAWLVVSFVLSFVAYWSWPYLVPNAVSVALPQQNAVTLSQPPSAFCVYTGEGFIYHNELMQQGALLEKLKPLPRKDVLLIATEGQTPISSLLPLIEEARKIGFKEIAFTVRQ